MQYGMRRNTGHVLISLLLVFGATACGDGTSVLPSDSPVVPVQSQTPTAAEVAAPVAVETLTAAPKTGESILELEFPTTIESIVQEESITVIGRTRVDAVVTVNDYTPVPDINGRFLQDLRLDQGANIIEIIVSLPTGEEESVVLAVIYVP